MSNDIRVWSSTVNIIILTYCLCDNNIVHGVGPWSGIYNRGFITKLIFTGVARGGEPVKVQEI
jgi:hypothetical protein